MRYVKSIVGNLRVGFVRREGNDEEWIRAVMVWRA